MNYWQDFVVVGLIALAGVYLARMFWFRMTKRTNACCDTCHGCSSTSEKKDKRVELLPLTTSTPNQTKDED